MTTDSIRAGRRQVVARPPAGHSAALPRGRRGRWVTDRMRAAAGDVNVRNPFGGQGAEAARAQLWADRDAIRRNTRWMPSDYRRLPGIRTVTGQSHGSRVPASECLSICSLDGAKRPRAPYRTWRPQVVPGRRSADQYCGARIGARASAGTATPSAAPVPERSRSDHLPASGDLRDRCRVPVETFKDHPNGRLTRLCSVSLSRVRLVVRRRR
jgi:hypothetical protein